MIIAAAWSQVLDFFVHALLPLLRLHAWGFGAPFIDATVWEQHSRTASNKPILWDKSSSARPYLSGWRARRHDCG